MTMSYRHKRQQTICCKFCILAGQDEWYIMFPRCNGRRQSPIDIYTEEAQYDSTLEPFRFEKLQYLDGLRMNLKNNGYTGTYLYIISSLLVLQCHIPNDILSVPIITNAVNSNLVHGEVHSMQHYVKTFVSDLRQVGGSLRVFHQ
jgi:hypothetical protein